MKDIIRIVGGVAIAVVGGTAFVMGMSRGEWWLQAVGLAALYGGWRFGSGPPDEPEEPKTPAS